jgi:hypothetical protein
MNSDFFLKTHFWWISQVNLCVEIKIDESEHGHVELRKSQHNFEIDVRRLMARHRMWHYPGDSLTVNVRLIVNSLDGNKDFSQCFCGDDVVHKFHCQLRKSND